MVTKKIIIVVIVYSIMIIVVILYTPANYLTTNPLKGSHKGALIYYPSYIHSFKTSYLKRND